MKRIVGGVHIQDDFPRRSAMAFDKHIHEELVDLFLRVVDLLVLPVVGFSNPKGLQSVEGTLAGQRNPAIAFVAPLGSGGIQLPTHGGQQRITAQLIVIVQILVAQADPDGPLRDQLFDRVLDEPRIPTVDEAAGKLLEEVSRSIDFPQKQCPGIGGDGASIEAAYNFSAPEPLKTKLFRTTICFHRRPFSCGVIGY
jgi:hypothetical protein